MFEFLKYIHRNDTRTVQDKINSKPTSARIIQANCPMSSYARFPISWKQITDASINRLFDDFSDVYSEKSDEPAFTLDHLRLFYEDSQTFFKKYEKF